MPSPYLCCVPDVFNDVFSADNLQLRERQKNIEAAHEIVCKGGSVTADKKKKNGKGKNICGDGKKVNKIKCRFCCEA